ncbi:MAG TPA: isoprenylcysteine carboxylmethyltransferase family protein [Casimicrobiaceae bacterium]|nr:isoprenylcysteine carboxylmethyltransferase family protein [Casimicrobiaceae bacterium]
MRDAPLLIVALTVSLYWLRVGAMVVRARRHDHHDVGVIPERPVERAMWLGIVPIVVAWCALPWLALTHDGGPFALPELARDTRVYLVVRWLAALAAVGCLLMTIRCWRRMGRDWRMDISDRNTTLITDGLFARIRHPIYAFSIAMMIATALVLPTPLMIIVAAAHVVLMNVKARNEEAHLARMHGESYTRYVARTGRFLPRPMARHS